jgi:hypothetical protein
MGASLVFSVDVAHLRLWEWWRSPSLTASFSDWTPPSRARTGAVEPSKAPLCSCCINGLPGVPAIAHAAVRGTGACKGADVVVCAFLHGNTPQPAPGTLREIAGLRQEGR